MPTINLYYQSPSQRSKLEGIVINIKEFVAKELTCGDINLKSSEISVRLLKVDGKGMIGKVEAEVNAFAFDERIRRQDEFCLDLMNFIQVKADISDVRTWLVLSELGHSWEK